MSRLGAGGFYYENRNGFIIIIFALWRACSILFKMLWKLPFPSCGGARSPRGLRVTPKGRGGKLQTRQSGDFPPSPLRFHPKNPFLTPLPLFPRFGSWCLGVCFFSGGFFAFRSPFVRSLKLLCCWGWGGCWNNVLYSFVLLLCSL